MLYKAYQDYESREVEPVNLSSKKSEFTECTTTTTEFTETDTSSEKLHEDLHANDLESKLDDEFKTLPEVKKCEENGGLFKDCFDARVLEVASMTVANGGDNISIYLPIFSVSGGSSEVIVVTIVVFYLLLIIWLLITSNMVKAQYISKLILKNGTLAVAPLIIGIGLYILSGSILFQL